MSYGQLVDVYIRGVWGSTCGQNIRRELRTAVGTPIRELKETGTHELNLVPKAGLEPARLAPHAPQTCVSAISPLRHSAGV